MVLLEYNTISLKYGSWVGSVFTGIQTCNWETGSISILECLWQGESVSLCCKLESCLLKRQYLLSKDIGIYLHLPCVGYAKLAQFMLINVTTHTSLDVVMAKPNHIPYCWWKEISLHLFLCWGKCAMLASLHHDIAQIPCIIFRHSSVAIL